MRATLLALLILAIAPASALAGGWATVGLSSTPDGTVPGEPWVVDLTVLQHGRSEAPLDGLEPTVTVSRPGGEQRTFKASSTEQPGVYRARVVFPSAGTWRYEVNDGFAGAIHEFPPAEIGRGSVGAAVSDSGPNVGLALLLAAVAGLGAGLLTVVLRRQRRAARTAEA
jgi:YtkA-like